MANKPKLTWEPLEGGSLLFRVTRGGKETSWKITPRTTGAQLWEVFGDLMQALDLRMNLKARQLVEPPKPQEALADIEAVFGPETNSRAELTAKAAKAAATGGRWYANLVDEGEELPLHTIGHGGETA